MPVDVQGKVLKIMLTAATPYEPETMTRMESDEKKTDVTVMRMWRRVYMLGDEET